MALRAQALGNGLLNSVNFCMYGAATEIAGVRIIGAPLWTDLQLYPEFDYLAEIMVSSQMMDYRAIRTAPQTTFTVDQMLRQHTRDKKTIFTELSKPHVGATVVMTHHMPLRELIAPWRTVGSNVKRAINNAFASDLWDEVRGFDIHT